MEEFSRFVRVNTYYNKVSFERSYIHTTQQTTGSWDMSLWELSSLYVDKRYWEFLFLHGWNHGKLDNTRFSWSYFFGLANWHRSTILSITICLKVWHRHATHCKSRLPLFAVFARFSNSSFLVLLMLNYKSSSQQQIHFFWWLGCGWNGVSKVSDDWGEWLSC